jgi:hypothetical protein
MEFTMLAAEVPERLTNALTIHAPSASASM